MIPMASVIFMIIPMVVGCASATTNRLPFINDNSSSNGDNNPHGSVLDMIELSLSEKHEQWMAQFGREYKNAAQKEVRFKIFKDNIEYIESVNRAGQSYKLGLNKFADLTNEEFKNLVAYSRPELDSNGLNDNTTMTSSFKYEKFMTDVPESIDWRDLGAVTPIKDQLGCGCCWIFSTVAAIEGLNQIKTGTLTTLSEQQILDCINFDDGRDKCGEGAEHNAAFWYVVKESDGLTTEDNYPYTGEPSTCQSDDFSDKVKITSLRGMAPNNEPSLEIAVAQQPVAVTIEGKGVDFQFYKSGVFDGPCGTTANHGVTIIGYGEEDGKKYWLFKNSWGTNWGEDGFGKILKFDGTPVGKCGIAFHPSYPVW